jgi:hypothetical protein
VQDGRQKSETTTQEEKGSSAARSRSKYEGSFDQQDRKEKVDCLFSLDAAQKRLIIHVADEHLNLSRTPWGSF